MLKINQIERLIMHTKEQLDNLKEHNLLDADPDHVWYRKGFITALKLVLYGDDQTINNKPVNKEKHNATRSNMD